MIGEKMFRPQAKLLCLAFVTLFVHGAAVVWAQTTAFTYQGKLTDAGNPANGNYDLQFKLFDALVGGGQQGATFVRAPVAVSAGNFTVTLDFGPNVFNGADRFLEIAVRPAGGSAFTTLVPRQTIQSVPYSTKSKTAETATNSEQLGGVDSTRFVRSDTSGNVSLNGNLLVSGTTSFNTVNAATQFNLGGERVLASDSFGNLFLGTNSGEVPAPRKSASRFDKSTVTTSTGVSNTFLGILAGLSNTTGSRNSFVGNAAGYLNTTGGYNSFFGVVAGFTNTTGSENSFFGDSAGGFNTTGGQNVFLGQQAGSNNTTGNQNTIAGYNSGGGCAVFPCGFTLTGGNNAFYGYQSGLRGTTGTQNSFFGGNSGLNNSAGSNNTFVGEGSGLANTLGSNNALLGFQANFGANNLTNATALGAQAFVAQSNSLVLGSINGVNGAIADTSVGIGTTAPQTRLQVKTASGFYGFTHTDGTVNVGSYVNADGGWLGTVSNHPLHFFINGGLSRMTVDTTGNVGIGTTAPGSKLSVAGLLESTTGGVKFPDGSIQTTAATPSANVILNQTTPQAGANFNIAGNGTVGGTLTASSAQVTGNGFVLGNFGIGTAAPKAKLDVTGGNILIDSPGLGFILKSPDGNTCRLLSVDNAGAVTLTAIACP